MLGHAKLVIRQDVYLCELTRRGKRGDTANVLVGVCVPRYDRYAQAHALWAYIANQAQVPEDDLIVHTSDSAVLGGVDNFAVGKVVA